MHTLTLLTLPTSQAPPPITSARALTVLANFVKHFFSCEECRVHFVKMARGVSRQALGSDGDAILWLWEAHNTVSARLSVEGGGDPLFPKHLFPSIGRCPYCYQTTDESVSHDFVDMSPDFNNTAFRPSESLLIEAEGVEQPHPQLTRSFLRARQLKAVERGYVWNRTAILLYLWNFYHVDWKHGNGTRPGLERDHHRVSQAAILRAAWPRRSVGDHYRGRGWQRGGALSSEAVEDGGICLEPYMVCVAFVALLVFWLHRRRKCKRLLH